MAIPGRKYQASNRYRYGFNGKENDPETVGTGSGTQDYGFRIYNPSLGKFLSVDPLAKDYPMLTPYQFASNRPIEATDLDGLEANIINNVQITDGKETYSNGQPLGTKFGKTYHQGTTVIRGPNARDKFNEVNDVTINIDKYGNPFVSTVTTHPRRSPLSEVTQGVSLTIDISSMKNSSDLIPMLDIWKSSIKNDIQNIQNASNSNNSIEVTGVVYNINGVSDKKEKAAIKKELTKYAKANYGKNIQIQYTENQSSGVSGGEQINKDGSTTITDKKNTPTIEMTILVKETSYSD